ncbi:alpha/beta fold hydrolase [Nocardia transvalensis]|uniref:alpha/beta fold hydrolase n=1 Tax=Nocardia transvalensis TaxID=37333 RepID=UPI001892F7E6|nr:alpha/beta hydrolase [Nocardia transvalensis]MBF6327091.1 alpha/beta hydrolase [Nocardia transvalensis]
MSSDRYLERPGARIAYQFTGSGSPVGYAHGVPLSRAAVRRLDLFDFDALGAGRRLLTYDQRGHGRSTGRPVAEDYLFENFTADLLALLDVLDLDEPMDFAGSSLGSDCALRAAIAAPDRFRRLALLIPPASWQTGPDRAARWYLDAADEIDRIGAAAWREKAAHAQPLPIFADYPQFDPTPDVPDELLASILRGVGMSELPNPTDIATLPHSTLILAWDTDPLHPLSTAHRLHDLMPNSTLHIARSVADIKTWTTRVRDFFA